MRPTPKYLPRQLGRRHTFTVIDDVLTHAQVTEMQARREELLRRISGLPSMVTFRRNGYRVFRPIRVHCFGHGGSWKELCTLAMGPGE